MIQGGKDLYPDMTNPGLPDPLTLAGVEPPTEEKPADPAPEVKPEP